MITLKHISIARAFPLPLSRRQSTNREVHVLLAAIAALCLAPATSIAQVQVPLTPSSVIGGSASLNDGGSQWDSTDVSQGEGFNGSNITDGDKSEDGIDSMWLVNAGGIDPAYLVIDLGDAYNINQIDLYNTHNRGGNNFGTGDFRIQASNSVFDTGSPTDFDLSGNIATILTGTLSDTSGENPITTVDSFSSITPHFEGAVRYLKFLADTGIYGSLHGGSGNNDLRGLNEIEVLTQDLVLGEATDFTWIPSNFGDWADSDNWSFESGFSASVNRANSPAHTAIFGNGISGPTTVSTHAAVNVNRVVFDNDTNSYAVAGLGSVNLVEGPLEEVPSIEVVAGNHEFQADVNLLNNTTADVASDAMLTFDNSLTLGGNSLTKIGDGTLAINNNLVSTGGTINCQAGTCSGSGTIGGDLNNSGGAVSPGNSAGILTIDGDYNQGAGGTLAIEIAGTSPGDEYDRLVVNGQANLAGTLAVTLLDSFTPLDGHTFDILDFNSVSGDFDSLNLPGGFDWNWDVNTGVLSVGSVVGGLAGDYDGNGVVDAADYTIYMDNLGGDSAVLGGNGSGASTVGQADYLLWKSGFGNTSGSGSSAAIPEPTALLLALLALAAAPVRVRCG
ncbi:MAG: hypothetical protein MK161_15075 [Pirellulales bacterium]|nr:hypothetical protein [Pirellulales bacterium]